MHKKGQRNKGEPLSSWMYREIRDRIAMCEIPPNELLVESRLANEYGVSRTPVREALSLLGREGIVQVLPRVGYRVVPVAIQDIHEIYNLRVLMEGEAAAMAAAVGDPSACEQLQEKAHAWDGWSADDVDLGDYIRSHDLFHLAIAHVAGNARLETFIGNLLRDGLRLRMSCPVTAERIQQEGEDRLALCEVLLRRDADEARARMRTHVLSAKEKALHRLISGTSRLPLGPL